MPWRRHCDVCQVSGACVLATESFKRDKPLISTLSKFSVIGSLVDILFDSEHTRVELSIVICNSQGHGHGHGHSHGIFIYSLIQNF